MTGNVVEFPKPAEDAGGPSLEGPARCVRCKHEWRAVTPVGCFDDLECPSCGTHHGVRTGTIGTHDGTVWQCNCGNDLFVLTMKGAPLCILCGTRATSWADG